MKLAFISIAAALAVCAIASPASADPFYVKAEVGTTLDTQVDADGYGLEFGDGSALGAYVGTSVGPFRVEAGVTHVDANFDYYGLSIDASANDYNATAYLDTSSGLYIGAGPSYIQAEASVGPYSVEQSGFGWHASGGYAFRAFGGVIEAQATYTDASLDDVDYAATRVTIGYRHAL